MFFGKFAKEDVVCQENTNLSNTEKCVICGVDTGIDKNEPTATRINYIEGCGQLCEDCFKEIEFSKEVDFPI